MHHERLWARVITVAVAAILIAGCGGMPVEEPQPRKPQHLPDPADLEMAIAHIARAQQADDEQWSRLYQLLARSAALSRTPVLRACAALVLAQGPRSDEELLRAEKQMSELLRETVEHGGAQKIPSALSSRMHQLVSTQHKQLLERIASRRELAQSKQELASLRAKLSSETAAHAATRKHRHQLLVELDGIRQKLRAVTQIELKHQSNGG